MSDANFENGVVLTFSCAGEAVITNFEFWVREVKEGTWIKKCKSMQKKGSK